LITILLKSTLSILPGCTFPFNRRFPSSEAGHSAYGTTGFEMINSIKMEVVFLIGGKEHGK
jgi:hypothetical protein